MYKKIIVYLYIQLLKTGGICYTVELENITKLANITPKKIVLTFPNFKFYLCFLFKIY